MADDEKRDLYESGRIATAIVGLVLITIIVVVVFLIPIFDRTYMADVASLAVALPVLAGVVLAALGLRALDK